MTRERKTAWLVLIVLVGFLGAVVSHYIVAQYVVRGYPFSTFLFFPNDGNQGYLIQPNVLGVHRFGDYFETWINSRGPNPYIAPPLGVPSSYFPVTHILLFPLAQLSLNLGLVLYLAAFTAGFAALIYRGVGGDRLTRVQAVIVLTVCSAPVLFLVDRANIEGLLFGLIVGSMFAYRRDRFYLAAVLLAIPIAMKGTPGAFWLLFALDGRIRALALSIAVTALSSLAALALLPGGVGANADGLRGALELLLKSTDEGTAGVHHSVSLKAAFNGLERWQQGFDVFVTHYMLVSLALLVAVAVALALLRPVLWQRVALITGAMIIVPSVSFEYRLIHLYIPLLLFLGAEGRRRSDALFVALFALLLVPKGLPIIYADVNIGTVVNPLLLLVLMVAIVVDSTRDTDGRARLDAIAADVRRRRGRRVVAGAAP